jgi:hypothetical protein
MNVGAAIGVYLLRLCIIDKRITCLVIIRSFSGGGGSISQT